MAPDMDLARQQIAHHLSRWAHKRITADMAARISVGLAGRLAGLGHEQYRPWSEEPAGRSMAKAERQIAAMLLVRAGMPLSPAVVEERARAIAQAIEVLGWPEEVRA